MKERNFYITNLIATTPLKLLDSLTTDIGLRIPGTVEISPGINHLIKYFGMDSLYAHGIVFGLGTICVSEFLRQKYGLPYSKLNRVLMCSNVLTGLIVLGNAHQLLTHQ